MRLRPLIVITGTVRVEGGDVHSAIQRRPPRKSGTEEKITVTHKRTVSRERRAANVISTGYMRDLREVRLLKTPFGMLCDPAKLPEIKKLITDATRDVGKFNQQARDAGAESRLTNCLVWEPLEGNRRAAIEGWVARQLRDNDAEVRDAISALVAGADSDRASDVA